ncbi:MAG TPA: hypothetical protein DD671_15220, partial [Balneolaceae bacterium]|nr:hypothetical protein [Balneolaceae bacterium]
MIYPDTPTGKGISLPDEFIKERNQDMQDVGLYHYGLFKGIFTSLKEIKHGCITLEITYPESLPENERDRNYILMVMAFVLGKQVLDQVYELLLLEYECPAKPGYVEFDYYTQQERNERVENILFGSIERKRIKDSIFE